MNKAQNSENSVKHSLATFLLMMGIVGSGVTANASQKYAAPKNFCESDLTHFNTFTAKSIAFIERANHNQGPAALDKIVESTQKFALHYLNRPGVTDENTDLTYFFKLYRSPCRLPQFDDQEHFDVGERVWLEGSSAYFVVRGMNPSSHKLLVSSSLSDDSGDNDFHVVNASELSKTTPGLVAKSSRGYHIGETVRIDSSGGHSAGEGVIVGLNTTQQTYVIEFKSGGCSGHTHGETHESALTRMLSSGSLSVASATNDAFALSADNLAESFETVAANLKPASARLVTSVTNVLKDPRFKASPDRASASFMAFIIVNQIIQNPDAAQVIKSQFKPAFDSVEKWYAQNGYTSLDQITVSRATVSIEGAVIHAALETERQSAKPDINSATFSSELADKLTESSYLNRAIDVRNLAVKSTPIFTNLASDSNNGIIGRIALATTGWFEKQ